MQSSMPGASSQAVVSVRPPVAGLFAGPEASRDPNDVSNNQQQETVQSKFATPPAYAIPPPSFSYGVVSQTSATSGSSKQGSTDGVKFALPAATAPMQPPVPTQPSSGPSFSYGIGAHASAGSSSSQQSHSSTVVNPSSASALSSLDSGKFIAPANAASLQPPAPGQSNVAGRPASWDSGTVAQNAPLSLRPPLLAASGYSFPVSLQVPAASEGSQNSQSSASTSAAVAQESSGITSACSSPMVNVPIHTSSIPNIVPAANPYNTVRMPAIPMFPSPPMMPGTPGTPGPPGIHMPAPSSSSNVNARPPALDSSASARPTLPSVPPSSSNSATVNAAQNVQQQMYSAYPGPPIIPPPQALWLRPPQAGGPQHPPFLPYPPVYPGQIPIPVRPVSFPPVTLPEQSQPPGVSPVGPPAETSLTAGGAGQQSSPLGTQSPPPGIDKETKSSDSVKKDEVIISSDGDDAWTAHKTEAGVVYYYNAITGESTYTKPSAFKGEPEKAIGQPIPISWEKLGSTDWSLVTTNDGKKYYYNTRSKVSSWQIPIEVVELRKKQESESSSKMSAPSAPNSGGLEEKSPSSVGLSAPAVNSGGRDAMTLRPSAVPVGSSALDLIKRKLQDAGTPAGSSPLPASSVSSATEVNDPNMVENTAKDQQLDNLKEKIRDANGDGNMSDSSSDSDDNDGGPSKDKYIMEFKEMLKEKGIAPFSKWDKELPKIILDPRFKAVPGYALRRSLFEHYVRNRAEEARKEKRAAQKAAVEGFKQLLEEASEDIDHKTDYATIKQKWGNDPRFLALDRKEREQLLNEKVHPLRKAYEENVQAARAAAVSSFKSMLRDNRDINSSSRWSRMKDSLRGDPRYKSVKHEEREILFNEYISELKAAEQEAERAARAKKEEEEKLKEREREMRKRKEREEQEMERVRLKARRKDAVVSYQALLTEKIKDPQASWTESKPKLDKDPLGRTKNPDLEETDMEKLFREHMKMLYERCAREFRALLAEVITGETASQAAENGKTALNSWTMAKELLKLDPRYSKLPRKERESLWRRHVDEIIRKQKKYDTKDEKANPIEKVKTPMDSRSSPVPGRNHGRR
ncbi:pre-mRNA-processing protein 40C isoform X1 [Nymphaea colorata]|nr:pre-mRNA-processing protein 40C isoform X1 [Nymphaea colorata]XP_031477097.1 pre-mRNA-processing protein 40C isoform X1 [Nymphaea colorata]